MKNLDEGFSEILKVPGETGCTHKVLHEDLDPLPVQCASSGAGLREEEGKTEAQQQWSEQPESPFTEKVRGLCDVNAVHFCSFL